VELVVRPYIVYARSSIHPMLVLLAFLGGGLVGGVFGFFLAPAMLGTISGIYQMIKSELTGIKRGHQVEKVDAFAAIQNN
jgi:predicted PurR-regulated permease PerM